MIGEPFYALNHRWFVKVRMRKEVNRAQWVSLEDFATESEAEGHWQAFRDTVAGMSRGIGKEVDMWFKRIEDRPGAVVVGRDSSEGVVFHVEPSGDKFRIVVNTCDGRWIYEKEQASRPHANVLRVGLRKSSRNLRGVAWQGWLNKKFTKEVV